MKLWLPVTLALALFGAAGRASGSDLSQPPSVAARDLDAPGETAAGASPVAQPLSSKASDDSERLPLAPPRSHSQRTLDAPRMPKSSTALTTVLGSLGVVLSLFFGVAWLLRRNLPKALAALPSEVLEPLGRAPLGAKQQLHLVRVGQKLVLLVVTPFGAEAVTEINDPDEVDRLCALCRQTSGHGPSAEFRAVLRQFEREPAPGGFLGQTAGAEGASSAPAPATAGRRRWGGVDA